jgi:hypothetical protein
MISPKTFARYASDPAAFRNDLLVDVSGNVRKFGDVMDDWQKDDFASLDPALLRCAGRSNEPAKTRAYYERPRGHSKTHDIAVTCVWALAFSTRPLKGYCFAADKDQAALLKDAMQTVVRLNPWLSDILDVQKNLVINRAVGHPGEGGTLTIETSDVASSWGILPDIIVADELTHWQGDGSLWHSLISSAAKRTGCLLMTIANAGFADSWQWNVREAARTDDAWIFSRLDGPVASWMTPDRLAEQRRMLPPVAFARLWLNQWSSGGGDVFRPEDIDAAFQSDLQPMTGSESGWLFVAGVDLGLTRDCSAVVTLAVPDKRWDRIRLADHRLWRPTVGQKIDLREVETYILELDRRFGLEQVAFDPWQAELLASRLEAHSQRRRRNQQRRAWAQPWMVAVQPTGASLREQASLVIESFNDHRLALYDCQPLKRDLIKVRCEEKSYGIRLVSPRDAEGHGDSFSAFALALLIGHEHSGKRPTRVGSMVDNSVIDVSAGVSDVGGHPLPQLDATERSRHTARMLGRLDLEAEIDRRDRIRIEQGGADHAGNEQWRKFMRKVGRL